jgi:RES domain-containing protein
VKLPHGWQAALDRLFVSVAPFDDFCFRSVELEYAHPDQVVNGEGCRLRGGRFAAKGTRAVYGSLDDETATGEVTARKARLGGASIISLKNYPRVTYVISIKATKCVDFRNVGTDAVLRDLLAAGSDLDDFGASQQIGAYLVGKGIDAIIFPSVTGSGANIVVFLDAHPSPTVTIDNRKEILEKLKMFGETKRA